jgi:GR25 family glycosyltransferase involved in LPS biosynthesis
MKLRLVHILNNLTGEREIQSINSLSPLKEIGVEYIQQVTPLYKGNLWKKPTISGFVHSGEGHYGCYESHIKAIKENFSEDLDALIVCECDCALDVPIENFLEEMKNTLKFCEKYDIYEFSWGGRIFNNTIQGNVYKVDDEFPNYCAVNKIIGTHFLVYPKISRTFFLENIDKFPWDTPDIWLNVIFEKSFGNIKKQATVFDVLTHQIDGYSIIDKHFKIMNFLNLEHKFDIYIDRDNNKIYITCDSESTVRVLLYEWFPENNNVYNDTLIYSAITNFNKNTFWYSPVKSMKNLNIRVLITLNDNCIKEKYFKIE